MEVVGQRHAQANLPRGNNLIPIVQKARTGLVQKACNQRISIFQTVACCYTYAFPHYQHKPQQNIRNRWENWLWMDNRIVLRTLELKHWHHCLYPTNWGFVLEASQLRQRDAVTVIGRYKSLCDWWWQVFNLAVTVFDLCGTQVCRHSTPCGEWN